MNIEAICIGSALWDVIADTPRAMEPGYDVPGRIQRRPGGVALNVAMALAQLKVGTAIVSAIGQDREGDDLMSEIGQRGIDTRAMIRRPDPTDIYMAIEAEGRLFGAVADCHSLEAAGNGVLEPLTAHPFGNPFAGAAIIDGNLPEAVLASIPGFAPLASAARYFIPASPGKARRLLEVLGPGSGTLIVNRIEAEIICQTKFKTSREAADRFATQNIDALITDGPNMVTLTRCGKQTEAEVKPLTVRQVTGAGDVFLAGFVAAELSGSDAAEALQSAVALAGRYIEGAAL